MNLYLLVFLIAVVLILVGLLGLGLIGWSKRRQAKRTTPRPRLPREPEIDLGAERMAYIASRDSYIEQRQLGRVA